MAFGIDEYPTSAILNIIQETHIFCRRKVFLLHLAQDLASSYMSGTAGSGELTLTLSPPFRYRSVPLL
jgi:hypothetical protein